MGATRPTQDDDWRSSGHVVAQGKLTTQTMVADVPIMAGVAPCTAENLEPRIIRVHDQIDRAEEALSLLVGRLHPILTEQSTVAGGPPPEEGDSQLAENLRNLAMRTSNLADQMFALVDRVDL